MYLQERLFFFLAPAGGVIPEPVEFWGTVGETR